MKLCLSGCYYIQPEKNTAISLFEKAASQSHIKSHVALGRLYRSDSSDSVTNYEKAFEHLNIAHESGDAEASFELALLLDSVTEGYTTDLTLALKYYHLAKKRGFSSAILYNNMAVIYMKNKKFRRAKKYFEKAKNFLKSEDSELNDLITKNIEKLSNEKNLDFLNSVLATVLCIIIFLLIISFTG